MLPALSASPVLLFVAAIIPDLDFAFYDAIGHHTITHSLTFWAIIYIPLFLWRKGRIIPYFLATMSHLLGDVIIANPPLLYGISDQRFGPIYQWAQTSLNADQFMFLRSIVDLSGAIAFVLVYKKSASRIFTSDRDAFLALPLLGVLTMTIFLASNLQDLVFGLNRPHDWPLYITTYAILGAAHLMVMALVILDAVRYIRERGLQQVNAR